MLELLLPSLNEGEHCKIFLELQLPPRLIDCAWNKPNLFTNALHCSCSSQYGIIAQSLISPIINHIPIIFSLLEKAMNMLEDFIIFLVWATWVLFNLYLEAKTNVFSRELYWKCLLHLIPYRIFVKIFRDR